MKKLSRSNSEQSVDNEANIYDSAGSVSTTIEPNVPDEILIKQERRSHSSANNDLSPPGQQSMPINLTNEHGKVKNEHALSAYGSGVDEEMHDYSNPVCKIGKKRKNFHSFDCLFFNMTFSLFSPKP